MVTARQTNREIVLLDDVALTGPLVGEWRGINAGWSANPRFSLRVTNSAGLGSNPFLPIRIFHSEDKVNVHVLFDSIGVIGDGPYSVYTEDLATRFPFPLVRAVVGDFTDITGLRATLVGIFDRSE